MNPRRLSVETYPHVGRPERTGILHLGPGAFHRAHQAVFTQDAGVADWGICGVTQRSANVVDQLRPQDGLFTVLERAEHAVSHRVVGAVREVLFAAEEPDAVRARFTDPGVRIVSLTVTEKGYGADSAVLGRLVDGLAARRAVSGAPLTVLSCDNLTSNGDTLRRLVLGRCAGRDGGLTEWVAEHVTFPNSMVDRIVPATTDADREEVRRRLGLVDAAAVVAEPFRQWVVEDRFAAGRPAWEHAGVQFSDAVHRYEAMKLRLLNGAHSVLAYLGALAGHATIAQAARDDTIVEVAAGLQRDALATLTLPDGVDGESYAATVLERFANPALRHRTVQVAMDGSQKLPLRLLGTVRDRLAAGETPRWAARGVAAWMAYVVRAENVTGAPLDDPLAARLTHATTGRDVRGVVEGLLGMREVFGDDLPDVADFRALLREDLGEFLSES